MFGGSRTAQSRCNAGWFLCQFDWVKMRVHSIVMDMRIQNEGMKGATLFEVTRVSLRCPFCRFTLYYGQLRLRSSKYSPRPSRTEESIAPWLVTFPSCVVVATIRHPCLANPCLSCIVSPDGFAINLQAIGMDCFLRRSWTRSP